MGLETTQTPRGAESCPRLRWVKEVRARLPVTWRPETGFRMLTVALNGWPERPQ